MIAPLAVAALTSAQLRQYLKVISIRSIQTFVPIVVLVQMFVLLRLFILPNQHGINKKKSTALGSGLFHYRGSALFVNLNPI
jgi:phosphotransferase system  glucose/maltose/N-acetylglucosamine-specific IIC component